MVRAIVFKEGSYLPEPAATRPRNHIQYAISQRCVTKLCAASAANAFGSIFLEIDIGCHFGLGLRCRARSEDEPPGGGLSAEIRSGRFCGKIRDHSGPWISSGN